MIPTISFRNIASDVIKSLLGSVTDRHSFFINDIDPSIEVFSDKKLVFEAVNKILFKSMAYTKNDCIRLSANVYGDVVALVIKQKNVQAGTIAMSMEPLQSLAGQLGGSISVVSDTNNQLTIAFSFYNGLRAA